MVPVAFHPDADPAFEDALVILAMGLACQIEPDPSGNGFQVLAESAHSDRIHYELHCYHEEQAQPAPRPPELADHPSGSVLTALWAAVLCASFWMQDQHAGWTASGWSSPEEIFQRGEWWRPFTALFLHGDLMHLLGNIASGTLFATWVCRSIGPILGWLLILTAGTIGNFLNASSHLGEPFSSLGASTAVFGALGILTGFAVFHALREQSQVRHFRYLIPLGGGLVLLSMTGVGSDPRTDVTAHLCGFAAGFIAGFAAGPRGIQAKIR